jgi:hypothetical protein
LRAVTPILHGSSKRFARLIWTPLAENDEIGIGFIDPVNYVGYTPAAAVPDIKASNSHNLLDPRLQKSKCCRIFA